MSNIEWMSVEEVILNRYWMKGCITIVKIAECRVSLHVGLIYHAGPTNHNSGQGHVYGGGGATLQTRRPRPVILVMFVVACLSNHEVLAFRTMNKGRACGLKAKSIVTAEVVCRMQHRATQNTIH